VLRRLPAFPGFPDAGIRRIGTCYHFLARSIVYQQLAGKAAETIHGRVCALTPGPRFPSAEELQGLSDQRLRSAGLSRNKLLALRDLARHVEDGQLRFSRIARLSDEAAIEELTTVRGIGVWTAQMFLIFRLGRLDVISEGDLGVQEGLRMLDELDERPGPKELMARAEAWKPLRSVGTWMMWRLVDDARGEA
jgi:3-methyladenine DNA glycosylase/8-oxoguanine DNA glycosylase